MQPICDAISVLGSRHGIYFDPVNKECGLIRYDHHEHHPRIQLKAGVRIGGEEFTLPLYREGGNFRFYDQRLSPCTMKLSGIHAKTNLKVSLEAVTPFRPRDAAFSTTPVFALRLSAEQLPGKFRWEGEGPVEDEIELFLELGSERLRLHEVEDDSLSLSVVLWSKLGNLRHDGIRLTEGDSEEVQMTDRIVTTNGEVVGKNGFSRKVKVKVGETKSLDLFWCSHKEPALEVQGERCPYKYTEQFGSLDDVVEWVRANPQALFENAAKVDGIIASNNLSQSINNLLAQTLHSFLINTWWVKRSDGRDWFSVWEGNCFFHSTVDVEFTQAPFYLALWPELLRIELDFWPEYSKDGTKILGERGKDTLFLSHDVGSGSKANEQRYHHEMPVEEVANYIILAYAYYKRTGDKSVLEKHADSIAKYLAFIKACDTTGSGIPDEGTANTIDDASPAVQFGKEQVYLAVKTLASYMTGAEILELCGKADEAKPYRDLCDPIREALHTKGWNGEHFVTILQKSGTLKNPWTGEDVHFEEIPGWDAPHIYTANAVAVLDMIGYDLGLDEEKLVLDLETATERCLREYGCVHTDFANEHILAIDAMQGLAGASSNPGWISMNMLRDIAAFYRGVDLRHLSDRYWNWQLTTNSQEPKIFFETFNGNNLSWYPRGVAIWGIFDAIAGLVIDGVEGAWRQSSEFPGSRVPRLFDADWKAGKARLYHG